MATKQAKRTKLKPVDPWPDYESSERIKYQDRLLELPEDVYREAGRHFTAAAFNQVKAALSPPKNYDLLKRLRRAAYDFHLFTAAKEGKIDLIELYRPKEQAGALGELIDRTADYLKFCESNPGAFLYVADPPEDWLFLHTILLKFKIKAEGKREKIALGKAGPRKDWARRTYESHLLKIYETARHERMTSRTGINTDKKKGKPYGPAFEFFSAAFKLIGLNLAPNSINTYLKKTIQKRDKIATSKLFEK